MLTTDVAPRVETTTAVSASPVKDEATSAGSRTDDPTDWTVARRTSKATSGGLWGFCVNATIDPDGTGGGGVRDPIGGDDVHAGLAVAATAATAATDRRTQGRGRHETASFLLMGEAAMFAGRSRPYKVPSDVRR
jgi:hypothetical protein